MSEARNIFGGGSAIAKHLVDTCSESIWTDVLIGVFRSTMASAHFLAWGNRPFTTDCWKVARYDAPKGISDHRTQFQR